MKKPSERDVLNSIQEMFNKSDNFEEFTTDIIEFAKVQQVVSSERFFELVNDVVNI